MVPDDWRALFAAALAAAEARARSDAAGDAPRRIACGFTNNVDRVVTLRGETLAALTRRLRACPDGPAVARIETPADCVAGLIQHIRAGRGGELPIVDARTARWITDHFPGQPQAGGTGARAANTLARLGFHALLHVTSLSAEQADHLDGSGRLLLPTGEGLRRPPAASRPSDPTMDHVIFEYQTGLQIPLPDRLIVAPQANRVIAPFDPINARLPIDPCYVRAVADPVNGVRAAIVSGYNQVADRAVCAERIGETIAAIRLWRRASPSLLVHLELGASPDRDLLAVTLEELVPHVDSLGLNADELTAVLELWGRAAPAGIDGTVAGLVELQRRLDRPRLGLHAQDYSLTLTRADPLVERRALLYAVLVASTQARLAASPAPADLRRTLEREAPSRAGLDAHRALSASVGMDRGVARVDGGWLVFVPTMAASFPAGTVGLGDSFTAGVLAML